MNSSNFSKHTVRLPYKLIKPGLCEKLLQLKTIQFSGNHKASSQKWKFKDSETIIGNNFHLKIQSCGKLGISVPQGNKEKIWMFLTTFFISQM